MSFAQELGNIGGFATPLVMKEAFAQALQLKGEVVKLYHKPQSVDCPCWNTVYETADAQCTQCDGTGKLSGFSPEPDAVFRAAVFLFSELRQDQHQRLVTKAGPVETMDGRVYCEGKWYSTIKIGDVVVYKTRGITAGTELRIISKMPRTANDGEVIFIRCDVEKQPSREVSGASVRKTI